MAFLYTQVGKGSKGSSVTELQKRLNQNGYNLAEDGVFGDKTLSAVRDYQANNNLAVDGIVGNKTWGALRSGNTTPSNSQPSQPTQPSQPSNRQPTVSAPAASQESAQGGFTYEDYKESDTVAQAFAALEQQLAAKPGAYESTWQGQINGIIDRILNREDFSYDVNSDALYQQYKDQYSSLGKLAMQDTMGQAAALTGGYGSSYASTAGNQAYQHYLSQLNEVVPELYGMARDQYNQEGQEMYNQYGLLADQESQDYGRYVNQYDQWASERNHLQGVYNDERSFDYGKYADDKNYSYNEYRNAIADQQWQADYDYREDRADVSDEQWEQTHELNKNADQRAAEAWKLEKEAYEKAKASGGTGGSGDTGSNSAALQHVASMSSEALVAAMQAYNYDEDNTGLAAFLDDCVASGRLTADQADNYYVKFRVGNDKDNEGADTTVEPAVQNSNFVPGNMLGGGPKLHTRLEER